MARKKAPVRASGSLGHAWRTLARSPRLAMLCVGLITLAVSMTLAFVHWPQPSVHDEFSYLLASDTFAHGRLSNPPHPMWKHFESFHIILQPSYASKYPPGQALVLAAGQVLTGLPLAGVWLSLAAASVALVWMLAGWVPWRWALFGGLIFALHTNIQLAWGHSYWGGAVAFAGASLLFGSYARLRKEASVRYAVILAAGAILLAINRPYEGLIASATIGGLLVWNQVCAKSFGWKHFASRLVLPVTVVLTVGLAGIGYYNQAVTGHALQMPYAVHEATYGISPLFVWQSPKPLPTYNHPVLQAFHEGWALDAWKQHQSLLGFLRSKVISTVQLWGFFFGAILTIPLLVLLVSVRVLREKRLRFALPMIAILCGASLLVLWTKPHYFAPAAPLLFLVLVREKRLRFALTMIAILYGASLLVLWTMPHYFAPAAPLLFLVLVEAVRSIRAAARRGWPMARHAPGFLLAAQLVLLLAATFSLAATPGDSWADARFKIAEELAAQPGQHLVLVSYDPDHNVHQEWVYNGADLEGGKVLWARSFGLEQDQPLLNYYRARKIWRVNADDEPRILELISGRG